MTFSFTYGDGVADIDIRKVVDFHKNSGSIATVTAVQPPARSAPSNSRISDATFPEKPQGSSGWVNGGFFVASPKILDYIDGDSTLLEREPPKQRLAADGQLTAYQHHGFWRGMDTIWDKIYLNDLWNNGNAPWKIWDDQLVRPSI